MLSENPSNATFPSPADSSHVASRLVGFCDRIRTLSDYETFLSSRFGIHLSPETWIRVRKLGGGWDPATIFQPTHDLSMFGSAWRAFLDSPRSTSMQDNEDRVVLLGCVLCLMETDEEQATESLEKVNLHYFETRRGVIQRLTSTLFFLARSLMKYLDRVDNARSAFEEVAALSSKAASEDPSSTQDKRRFGQRGVALLILARKDNDKTAQIRLMSAVKDLETARRLGDETTQHYAYELEALNRLYQLNGELEYLSRAIMLWEGLDKRVAETAGLSASIGAVRVSYTTYFESHGQDRKAFSEMHKAKEAFETAIRLLHRSDDARPYYMKLARSLLHIYTTRHRLGGAQEDNPDLDCVISNFEAAGPIAFAEDSPYSSALFFKADRLLKSGNAPGAIHLIDLALSIPLSSNPPKEGLGVQYRLKLLRSECLIWISHHERDELVMRKALDELLELANPEDISAAAVAQAIRDIHDESAASDTDPLLTRAVEALECSAHSGKHDGDALRFTASNAGTLLIKLFGQDDRSILERAHRLLLIALEASESTPLVELLSWLATTSISLGRLNLSDGDTRQGMEFLEDARDYYLKVIDECEHQAEVAIDVSVVHSRLAVLCLRVQALTGGLKDAEAAIFHMNKAIELGGVFPKRYGHLGDAYYRIGRIKRDANVLAQAVEFKRRARSGEEADESRENRSVTAAALVRIWHEDGNPDNLCEAIDDIASATVIDPSWPWPCFQLADILEQAGIEVIRSVAETGMSNQAKVLLKSVAFDFDRARLKACELAVRTDEFKHRNIGGRKQNEVHVLDDPHHLLSQTVVFKQDQHGAAKREVAALARLDHTLKVSNAPARFRYIQSIGVVNDETGRPWYATTYEPGLDLGRIIFRYSQKGVSGQVSYDDLLADAVHFLALFHVSGGIDPIGTNHSRSLMARFWSEDVDRIVKPFKSKKPRSKLRGIEKQSLKDLIGVDQHAEA